MKETGLVNMELSPAEAKELTSPNPGDAPKYPWGLELRLESDQLTKLGIAELPKVGTTLQLVARVEVCGTHEHDSQSGATRSVELQVTDMALTAAPEAKPDKAGSLYPSMRARS